MRTQPIAIARNHHNHHHHHSSLHHSDHHCHNSNHSHHSRSNDNSNNSGLHLSNGNHHHDDSDSGDENNYAKAFFCESLNDLNTNMGGLTVGSLPSSRREKRFLVSTGTNESLLSSGGGLGPYRPTPTSNNGGGGIGGAIARSMPPPRAPFLSSRRESDDRLESMPIMDLPESATEYGSHFKGPLPPVMPYGSLRESRFHQRRVHDQPPSRLREVRFDLDGNSAVEHGSCAPEALSSSYTGDGFYPQSLPVNKFEQNIIQKRWESINKNNKNKTNKLLDSSIHSDNTEDHVNRGKSLGSSGIGSLLECSSTGSETSHNIKAQNDKPVGNLSSQLECHNSQKSSITTTKNNEHEPNNIQKQSIIGQNNNRTTGIGKCLETSSLNSSFSFGKQINRQHNVLNDSFSLSQDADTSFLHTSTSTIVGAELMTPDDTLRQEQQLSTSLTGLEILESSRSSPGGLGVNLTKAEKDGLMMLRARTYSDDKSKILYKGNENYVNITATSDGSRHFYSQNHLIPPENLLSPPPNLIAPNNYHFDYSNLNHNNALDDSYDTRPVSPQNPDTEGAFDLDFE